MSELNIIYSIEGDHAVVTGYSGEGDTATILSEYEGYPVTMIGSNAFEYCDTLTSITIENNVIWIGHNAFCWCENLISVDLPDSVIELNSYAFGNCYKLTAITLGNNLKSISSYAFAGCFKLNNIVLPDSLRWIGHYAFGNCNGLTSIIIPKNVATLGESVVTSCDNLAIIYCEAKSKPIGWAENWKAGCNATVVWGYEYPPYIGYFKQNDEKMLIKTKGSLVNGLATKLNEVQTSINALNTEVENTDKIFTFTEVYKKYM